jgi:glycerophosphoryl diester phosphodiesterase
MDGFESQGHRGARGLRPENTLPSFEAALDVGVDAIETDLLLTRDNVVVICHDPVLSDRIFGPSAVPRIIRQLTLAQLRTWRAAGNPDPHRFPAQNPTSTPLATAFAAAHGFDPLAVPTLVDLIHFVAGYAGEEGRRAGKEESARQRAGRLRFDLELKRIPFHPEAVGDGYDGTGPRTLEEQVVQIVRAAGVVERTTVRSFDHRCVRYLRELEPGLTGAVLVAESAPVDPGALAREAGAALYCPAYTFLDQAQVRQLHAAGVRVVPWTVNDPGHMRVLLDWGVDGMTTDHPERLTEVLRQRRQTA